MSLPRFQSKTHGDTGAAPKLHVVTFGCQMNKYDSLSVEGKFRRQGWQTTEAIDEADLVLFNTCSVREHAEERVFSWVGELRKAKERRPELMVGVMGCMAERLGDEIYGRSPVVDLVVGTRSFQHLPALVDELREKRAAHPARTPRITRLGFDEEPDAARADEPYVGGRHAYLTVMRGCDLNCTFCIVPKVRGRVLSRGIEAIVDEARWMIDSGAQVITLLGQTVNSWGEDLAAPAEGEPRGRGRQGRPALADLLYRLQELSGLARLRLITLHPSYVTPALAQALRDCDKCDRFLPLPAQSGSDDVLRRMKRGYTTDLYRRRADILREHCPDIELGTDWIVGFPGETDADFAATESFLAEQRFVVNYVFQYSPRPSTAAEALPDDVPAAIKRERNNRLLELAESVQLARLRENIGRTLPVFVEEPHDKHEGLLRARAHTGLSVSLKGAATLVGTTQSVKIEDCTAYSLAGTLASELPAPPPEPAPAH
jgi:tRNA-2-methylthio-N6-dimethylallyladenosine synthase